MKDIILDQGRGKEGECSGFAILGALVRMKDVDYNRIAREMIEETGNSGSLMRAKAWFIKKGYIKGLIPVRYSPFILNRKPIITSFRGIDWNKTMVSPYKITLLPGDPKSAHYMCIVAPGKLANSWGRGFGDNGYCYFGNDDLKRCTQMFVLDI